MDVLLFLLLPVAAFSGWLSGRKSSKKLRSPKYYAGFDYSLSAQSDKTVDALVQMPAVDDDTIETHLTLGCIFRRRGELERAIRLHQGLLQRPALTEPHKSLAYLELARDYLAAGVLDRAEVILKELSEHTEQQAASLQHLLELYQQEKEWVEAIKIAKRLQKIQASSLSSMIAHFYCELADLSFKQLDYAQAKQHLKNALRTSHTCPRALILRAKIEQVLGNCERAVKIYKLVVTQNIELLHLVLPDIVSCYQKSRDNTPFFEPIKTNTKFRCSNCGFMASKLQWYCPSCKQWDTSKPLEQGTI